MGDSAVAVAVVEAAEEEKEEEATEEEVSAVPRAAETVEETEAVAMEVASGDYNSTAGAISAPQRRTYTDTSRCSDPWSGRSKSL